MRRLWYDRSSLRKRLSFPRKLIDGALADLGYRSVELRPVPSIFPETEFSKIDWYRVIAQKP